MNLYIGQHLRIVLVHFCFMCFNNLLPFNSFQYKDPIINGPLILEIIISFYSIFLQGLTFCLGVTPFLLLILPVPITI